MSTKGTCKADSCEKDVRAKGYCDPHYRKWRKGKMGKPRHTSCTEKACGKARFRRGLCDEHFRLKHSKAAAAPETAAIPAGTEAAADAN